MVRTVSQYGLNSFKGFLPALSRRFNDMALKPIKCGKLPVQLADRTRIGERIAATMLASCNGFTEYGPQYDVMEWQRKRAERIEKPGTNNAIHHDKKVTLGISFCGTSQNINDSLVLCMSFRQVGLDKAIPDIMPKIV